jgi:hypothetical protein
MASRADVLIRAKSASSFALLAIVVVFVEGLRKGSKKGMERQSKQLASLYISSIRERLKALLLEAFPFVTLPSGKKSAEGSNLSVLPGGGLPRSFSWIGSTRSMAYHKINGTDLRTVSIPIRLLDMRLADLSTVRPRDQRA